jgi:hypothetical protein
VRLAYNKRSPYWGEMLGQPGWQEIADFSSENPVTHIREPYVLHQLVHEPGRLDLSASYTFRERFTLFADWTNILSKPQKVDLVRLDPTGPDFDPGASDPVKFAWHARYTERILSLGVRFRFGS